MDVLLSVYVSTGQNIDSLWNFFLTVHLGICGVIVYVKRVDLVYLFFLGVGYVGFTLMNLRAKINDYMLYESIVSTLKEKSSKQLAPDDPIVEFFVGYMPDDRVAVAVFVHIASFVLLGALLGYKCYRNSSEKSSTV